jgi:Flp pilus assembly protein TadD
MEPKSPDFIFLGRLFQQETKMRNLLIAACCAALVGSVSIASAKTTGMTTGNSIKTHHPMDSYAKMKKKKSMKKTAKSGEMSKDNMSKGDMSKDNMKKDNMSK